MTKAYFNAKTFNSEAFGKYEGTIPTLRLNALIGAGVLAGDGAIQSTFSENTGMESATVPMFGRASGYVQEYDGGTNLTTGNTANTYTRTAQVFRKAGVWTERDFSYDITGGVDFLSQMAGQIVEHKQDLIQDLMLGTLDGLFSMPSTIAENGAFVSEHTLDITETAKPGMSATTLNGAIQKACGDRRGKFTLGAFSSKIVSDLEDINAVDYLTQTDSAGMTRSLAMGTWNGKTIFEDDGMPTYGAGVFRQTTSDDSEGIEIVATSATPGSGEMKLSGVTKTMFGYVPEVGDYVKTYDKGLYVSYIMGAGAFGFFDVGAKVPYEAIRDPLKNGGEDSLISRVGYVMAPYGFSFEPSSRIANPKIANFKDGANWTLATDNTASPGDVSYFPAKDIPIARIISLA